MRRFFRAFPILLPAILASCGAAESPEPVQQSMPEETKPSIAPDALRSAVADDRVRRVYEARGWRAIWDEARERTLFGVIAQAGAHGLAPDRFLRPDALPREPARRDAALTLAAIRYAEALANGVVDPAGFRTIYAIPRTASDVVPGLVRALGISRIARWYAGLAPEDAQYRALSRAYLQYREAAELERRRPIPIGPSLHPGESDPRVPEIRAALDRRGYAVPREAHVPVTLYASDMAAAIALFQEDSGLRRDGVLGPNTLAVLNKSAAERARQLAVNLERLRWLDRAPAGTRIDVNTGAAELVYWRDGLVIDRRRVAVGRPGWATPQLSAPIWRLVANPSWTVPHSIARAELKGKDATYLAHRNMRRKGGWIIQQPGPGNALGRVKFDMRDRYAIYLHDTPTKDVFARSDRHLSHGCVRVEGALDFARLLAEQDGKMPAFDAALASGEERYVNLDQPIRVRLIYLTAFLEADGVVRFRPDIYGWDDDVGRAMGLGGGRHANSAPPSPDIGP